MRILGLLTILPLLTLTPISAAQTVIGFDDFIGVVTDQYPQATFATAPGAEIKAIAYSGGTTRPNIICTAVGGVLDCKQPIYIDFTVPANGLTFWAIAANVQGVTAQFNIYQDGAFTATVDLVSSGGSSNKEFVDLSSFENITRLEIVNILDDPAKEAGIGWDTFSFNDDVDTDGDGLLDSWETEGIPYIGGNGFDLLYVLPGADPLHKDLYVEVDAMAGFGLTSAAVTMLEDAYDQAPVTNPDGINGITLHVLRDETSLPHVPVWQTNGCWPFDFDLVRSVWYGSAAERAVSDPVALLAAKSKAVRYCIAADTSGPNVIGGCGLTPGDSFVIFINRYSDEQQAAVFMHELGHNLGLRHGGGDSVNGKCNYPSVMNYVMSYRASWNTRFWRLDYSRAEAGNFPTLEETALNELAGIGIPTGIYGNTFMPYGVNVDLGGGTVARGFRYLRLDGSANDFGDLAGTGFQDARWDPSVIQDLNYVTGDNNAPSGIPNAPSPGQTLTPFDDWANVHLRLAASIGPGAPAPGYPIGEIGLEAIDWIDANFPDPPIPCLADTNGDGILDLGDVQAFVTLFLAQDLAADFNADGILDLGDISAFVNLFLAGC